MNQSATESLRWAIADLDLLPDNASRIQLHCCRFLPLVVHSTIGKSHVCCHKAHDPCGIPEL
jgi:hypothetical protein